MAKTTKRTLWVLAGAAAVIGMTVAIVALGPGHFGRGGATAEERPAAEATSSEASPSQKVVMVTVEKPITQPIQRSVQMVGSFAGYDEVTVMAEVPGRVVEIYHDVSDVVKPGQPLLKIDQTDYELALLETRRSLELEATRVGLPIPNEDNFQSEKIAPLVKVLDPNKLPLFLQAREKEENARKKLERSRQLREQNNISQEAHEQVETDYEVARNTRIQAEMDSKAAIAAIKHRLILLRIAEEKFRKTNVIVPIPTRRSGMPEQVEYSVAERKVTEGEMVKDAGGASTAAFELVMDKVLKLKGTVPERFIAEVKVGQKVEIQVDAYPGRKFNGEITRVSPSVDRVSRAFQVEALVPNSTRELKPGGFAKADILTRVDPKALMVPLSSLVTFVGSTRVYVVRDGKAHAVPVTPGVEIRLPESQQKGERVWVEVMNPDPREINLSSLAITTGHNQLAEGSSVKIREPDAKVAKTKAPEGGAR